MKDTLIQNIINNINNINLSDLKYINSYITDNCMDSVIENGILNSTTFYYNIDYYNKEIVKFRVLFLDKNFYFIRESQLNDYGYIGYINSINEDEYEGYTLEDYIFKKMKFKKSYQEAKQALIVEYQELIEASQLNIKNYMKEIQKLNQE